MARVIGVKFTFSQGDLWFDPADTGAKAGDHVVCSTERGTEIGLAIDDPRDVSDEELEETIGDAELKPLIRVATDDDLDYSEELAEKADEALPVFRKLAKESGLPMKPVGVEYLFGGERVVCYFAAEERVDFRQLVRDLSRALHERIDMRQIGVREEAALMGGYAHCGQELCCTRWERRFDPVSIRMAKEQDLPLNSPKISGVCGRLMCCLRYEFEAYRDFKGRAPKKNATIKTPLGDARITGYNTPREQLDLRLENGKHLRVPLEGMECSPEACKKAEDNNCPCRPDTVTRSMLEALDSPDVQMALAEIDRENGLLPPETYDDNDIVFVSEDRRRRRRKQVEEQKAEAAEREAQRQRAEERRAAREAAGKPNGPARRRRRHHGSDEAAKAGDAAQRQGQAKGERADQAPAKDNRPGRATRCRTHTAAGDAARGAGAPAKPQGEKAPKGAKASGEQQAKKGEQQAKKQGGPKQGKKARPKHFKQDPAQGGEAKAERAPKGERPAKTDHAPKADHAQNADKPAEGAPRRRRRRGGRGRGKGGNGGSAPAAPAGE